jgi:hypothetical protein
MDAPRTSHVSRSFSRPTSSHLTAQTPGALPPRGALLRLHTTPVGVSPTCVYRVWFNTPAPPQPGTTNGLETSTRLTDGS